MDGWKQAGVGPSLAGMVSLVSCGLRCGARRKSELRWEQAAEKVPRRNFPLKLKIDVLPCDSFIIMKTLFKIGCKEQVKVKNKVSVFLSAGSVGGCNRGSLSNDSWQCKEFGEDGWWGWGRVTRLADLCTPALICPVLINTPLGSLVPVS